MMPRCSLTLCIVLLCSLGSAVAQTEWTQHPDNPVFTPPSGFEQWGHAIAWDGSMYHMIFEHYPGLGHATSSDGVEWRVDPASPVLKPGPPGAWNSDGLSVGAMIREGGVFHLWYSGCDFQGRFSCTVGYATSTDGSVWIEYPSNPVLAGGETRSFDEFVLNPGSVVFSEGAYRMWYTAISRPTDHASGHVSIGYAESPDKISWTRHPIPVVDSGSNHYSDWDYRDVWTPSVVFDGSRYQMWYSGAGHFWGSIGYAWSTDGIEWIKHPDNPIISGDFVEGASASDPEVLFDGSSYRMWYLAGGGIWNFNTDVINYATSGDATGRVYWQIIPAATLAAGAKGAFFRTAVEISNTDDDFAEVVFEWLPRGQDNPNPLVSAVYVLEAGESRRFDNALAEIFGLGADSYGALRVTSSTGSVIGMSRTSNVPTGMAGTFGAGIPALTADEMIGSGETRRVTFLCDDASERANVGCVNGTDHPIQVRIGIHDSDGTVLAVRTMSLGPYANDQINRVLQSWQPIRGYVDVWSDTDGALFTCYGSVVDNLTNDPMTVLPQ